MDEANEVKSLNALTKDFKGETTKVGWKGAYYLSADFT